MTARTANATPWVACFVLPFIVAGCNMASPCTLPTDLALPIENQWQIALPGLDVQLRKCITSIFGQDPYPTTGHEDWDRYLAGDNSALTNRAKVGALLFLGGGWPVGDEGAPVVETATDFERFYREHSSGVEEVSRE